MQDLFSSNTTLLDAETILESFFVNDGQEHIVTHRINLSPNDAYHLMESFNSIQYAELDFYMKVKLAIVVGWIFSKKYAMIPEVDDGRTGPYLCQSWMLDIHRFIILFCLLYVSEKSRNKKFLTVS